MLFWIRTYVLASLVTLAYRLWSLGWRIEKTGIDRKQIKEPIIGAHFHGDELLLLKAYIGSGMVVMSSTSRDGAMMKKILEWFGFRVVSGSSTRGGVRGLKGMLDILKKEKTDVSLAVDGPRGPLFQVKPGIIKIAQETGYPILPGSGASKSAIVFKKAWNKCYLPWPFSRSVIVYGNPIHVPKELSENEFENIRLQVQNELLKLKARAEAHFDRKFIPELVSLSDGA